MAPDPAFTSLPAVSTPHPAATQLRGTWLSWLPPDPTVHKLTQWRSWPGRKRHQALESKRKRSLSAEQQSEQQSLLPLTRATQEQPRTPTKHQEGQGAMAQQKFLYEGEMERQGMRTARLGKARILQLLDREVGLGLIKGLGGCI